MSRTPWLPLIIGAVLLVLSSGLSAYFRPVLTGLFDPSTLAALIDSNSSLHWIGRVVGLIAVGYGGLLFFGGRGHSRPLPVREAAGSPPSGPSRPRVVQQIELKQDTDDPAEAEAVGDFRKAGDLFYKKVDFGSAARCYSAAARGEADQVQREALLRLCLNSAKKAGTPNVAVDLLAHLGEYKQAAEIARGYGDLQTAAALLLKSGDHLGAVQALEAAGDVKGAARALASAGKIKAGVGLLAGKDPRAAAEFAAEQGETELAIDLFLRVGDAASAAALLAFGSDPRRAADLYMKAGDEASAARYYEQAGAEAEAAPLFLKVGQHDRAADLYRKLGDQAGLAACLEAQGLFVDAARIYFELGKPEEAGRTLRALPANDRSSPGVRILLASYLVRVGQAEQAIGVLRPIVAMEGLDKRDICEAYYNLGIAYQLSADDLQAQACFRQVLTLNAQFRDTPLRLAQLGSQMGQGVTDDGSSSRKRTQRNSGTGSATGRGFVPERYEIESRLGVGSMGVVYKARDKVLDRWVAVKVLSSAAAEDETMRNYFMREAKVMASLNHPHIVTVFDAGITDVTPYLVMEHLQGTDLKGLGAKGEISERSALIYTAQVADALTVVHQRGIVHRDVKPANIFLLAASDRVKLMDFGVAHSISGNSTRVAGTPYYMAPEQVLGEPLGPWTDIYALGGTLYALLTGKPPFPEGEALVHAVRTAAPDPRILKPSIRVEVATVVLSCLAKTKDERPANAEALRARLESLAKTSAA